MGIQESYDDTIECRYNAFQKTENWLRDNGIALYIAVRKMSNLISAKAFWIRFRTAHILTAIAASRNKSLVYLNQCVNRH